MKIKHNAFGLEYELIDDIGGVSEAFAIICDEGAKFSRSMSQSDVK